jgi:hypothetical protein
MQDYALRVGEELLIDGHIRLSIMAVEEDEVFLGVTTDPNDERGLEFRQWRLRLMAASAPLPHDNRCRLQTLLSRPRSRSWLDSYKGRVGYQGDTAGSSS